MLQVHKEPIDKIPNALPHRNNTQIDIYGMEGIPDEDMKEHERKKNQKGQGRKTLKIELGFDRVLCSENVDANYNASELQIVAACCQIETNAYCTSCVPMEKAIRLTLLLVLIFRKSGF